MDTPFSAEATWARPRKLHELTSAPGYADAVTTVVGQIAAATEPSQAVVLLQQASQCLGAESAAFVSFIPDDGTHASYRFLLACDPTWCFEYENRHWYADDPWLDYACHHSEPACASTIFAQTKAQQDVLSLAERFGFRSAVIVPAPSSVGLGRAGVLCLGSSTPAFFEADGFITLRTVARGLAMELHEWWIAQLRREVIDEAELTETDLKLVQWEWQGLNSKQIGNILGMGPASVDSRFQRLNLKLGVPNRRAAAKLAAEYGLI